MGDGAKGTGSSAWGWKRGSRDGLGELGTGNCGVKGSRAENRDQGRGTGSGGGRSCRPGTADRETLAVPEPRATVCQLQAPWSQRSGSVH